MFKDKKIQIKVILNCELLSMTNIYNLIISKTWLYPITIYLTCIYNHCRIEQSVIVVTSLADMGKLRKDAIDYVEEIRSKYVEVVGEILFIG